MIRSRVTFAITLAAAMLKLQRVAADERGLRDGKRAHRQAVDEHVIRRRGQRRHRAAHRFVRGAQDIQAVDLLDLDDRHRPGDFACAGEFRVKPLALPAR